MAALAHHRDHSEEARLQRPLVGLVLVGDVQGDCGGEPKSGAPGKSDFLDRVVLGRGEVERPRSGLHPHLAGLPDSDPVDVVVTWVGRQGSLEVAVDGLRQLVIHLIGFRPLTDRLSRVLLVRLIFSERAAGPSVEKPQRH